MAKDTNARNRVLTTLSSERMRALKIFTKSKGSKVTTEGSYLLSQKIDELIDAGSIDMSQSEEESISIDANTQAKLEANEAKSRVLKAIATGDVSELEPRDLETVSKSIDVTTDEIKKMIEAK